MKYKIWDNQNQCWYKPTYEENSGKIEEILMTQSGELCMRVKKDGQEAFIHESALMYPYKTENGEELLPRFASFLYTGTKDSNGKKLFVGDLVKDVDGVFQIRFGNYKLRGDMTEDFIGFYLQNIETKQLHHFSDASDLELIEKGGQMK